MKCPGCNETNEVGMQFCIYCGQGLQAAPAPPAPLPPQSTPVPPPAVIDDIQSRVMSTSQTMVLICTVCSKTDPLNGQFCVFCGGRTISGTAPVPIVPAMNFGNVSQASLLTGQTVQPEFKNMSEELPRVPVAPRKSNKSAGPALIIWVLLAILLGAASGAGTVLCMKDDVQKSALHSFWPGEGILVFSSAKNADVKIADNKQKSIIFGKTSSSGTLYMPSMDAGAYELSISDESGKAATHAFNVNVGENHVIGYPHRLELK